MDVKNNDLIALFESYYRVKEKSGEIPSTTLKHSIHAGIVGLDEGERSKMIIKDSINDFKRIASLIEDVYNETYQLNSSQREEPVPLPKRGDILTLDEAIAEFKLPRRAKDPKWRAKNPEFPIRQPTGARGKITVSRAELERYLKGGGD